MNCPILVCKSKKASVSVNTALRLLTMRVDLLLLLVIKRRRSRERPHQFILPIHAVAKQGIEAVEGGWERKEHERDGNRKMERWG